MAIIYRPLGKSYLDSSEWPALMEKFERNIPLPYDDKSKKHIATIGIGVNLRERNYLALVLKELGVFAASDATAPPGETTEQRNTRYNEIIDDFMAVIERKRGSNLYP